MWYMTYGIRHMTCNDWHVTYDTWWRLNIFSKNWRKRITYLTKVLVFKICCHLRVFFPPNLSFQNFRVHKKIIFFQVWNLGTPGLLNQDGVVPIDNRPCSSTTLYIWTLRKLKKIKVACDTWQMTRDMWQVTCDMWHVTFETWHILLGEHSLKISAL